MTEKPQEFALRLWREFVVFTGKARPMRHEVPGSLVEFEELILARDREILLEAADAIAVDAKDCPKGYVGCHAQARSAVLGLIDGHVAVSKREP